VQIDPEGDAKRAVAFVPQSDAAFIQREEFLWIEEWHPWLIQYLTLPTHDSIIAEVPEAMATSAANVLHAAMTQPWAELGGLSIGVEIKVGYNLLEQEEIQIERTNMQPLQSA